MPPGPGSAYPYAGPPAGWPGGASPGQPAGDDASAARRRAGTALGWAIGAAVAAGLALVLGVVAVVTASAGGLFGGGGFFEPLRGRIDNLTAGSPLSGTSVEDAVTRAQDEFGYYQEEISCPDTDSVSASTAIVCTGRLDGYQWTGIVFFEDDEGTFVVLEL